MRTSNGALCAVLLFVPSALASWVACRSSDLAAGQGGAALSSATWAALPACFTAVVPGTAFVNLLANGSFPGVTDPFVDNLLETHVPDINSTGPEFYTLWYETKLAIEDVFGCNNTFTSASRVLLTIGQSSYRTSLFMDGVAVPPLGASPGLSEAVGMFKRHDFLLPGSADAFCSTPVHGLAILVLPPDHPGKGNCGQGGDHEIAQDLVSQDTAGWDWVQAAPDRNTGIIDLDKEFFVSVISTGVLLRDPAVTVTDIVIDPANPTTALTLTGRFRVSLQNLDTAAGSAGNVSISVPDLGIALSIPLTLPPAVPGSWLEIDSPSLALNNVSLWWPHTLGAPTLHVATATFTRTDSGAPSSTVLSWNAGFRHLTSVVDAGLGGRVFYVNGQRMWVNGGNYIASDQFSRSEFRGITRYGDEVRAHREMGMNVIRLWGGHGGHGTALWNAADYYGVMLFQEFWMSGDNNGRWAGNYSWPLDHGLYLSAAEDTVRSIRGHPSLFLYNAGNELWPLYSNPSSDIAIALPELIARVDPRSETTYVQSSMGSDNGYTNFVPEMVLAPTDGVYGILDEREFFTRNPGIQGGKNLGIAFQPEIGNTAHPDYESLCRFLTPAIREVFPSSNAAYNAVNSTWAWHNYLPFTDGGGTDHIFRLSVGGNGTGWNASEYSAAAAFAQYVQYQALFEGFQDAVGMWYQTVIMWKSASPWPALRGSLYDYYLASAGGFWGARAANGGSWAVTSQGLRVQLNRGNASVTVLNLGLLSIPGPLTVTATAYDITTGQEVPLQPPFRVAIGSVGAGSAVHCAQALQDPVLAPLGSTLLWRLDVSAGSTLLTRNDYILNTLATNASIQQDYGALAAARAGVLLQVQAAATGLIALRPEHGTLLNVPTALVNVTVSNHGSGARADGGEPGPSGASTAAVATVVTVSLRCAMGAVTAATGFVDDRVLPQWPSDGYFQLLPGESREVSIEAPLRFANATQAELQVVVRGWNVAEQRIPVILAV